jgi:MFS family permease
MSGVAAPRAPSERWVVFLIGAVQFVNIWDFVMVMPLGPDFARALGIPLSRLGLVGGAYTAAAAVAGVVGSTFLDRFDRRPALAVAMSGLALGTLGAGFAWDFPSLLAARVVAGAFGGPATSLSLSIVAGAPPERREGMGGDGAFGGGGAGRPLSLALWGMAAPFWVGGLGLVVTALVTRPSPACGPTSPAANAIRARLSSPLVLALTHDRGHHGCRVPVLPISAYVQGTWASPEQLQWMPFLGG